MAKGVAKNTLGAALDLIQTQMTELRQTEALEAQIHEMVVGKRHRLDVLMGEFLALAAGMAEGGERVPMASPPSVPSRDGTSPTGAVPVNVAPTPPPVISAQPPRAEHDSRPLPLTTLPPGGAPKDLLHANGNRNGNAASSATPPPSAQQVLDSLNRLMSGLKEISGKPGSLSQAS
ncbi:hypothetical protein [Bryobacter aggregatus]|uniref:hypothetical protein n=1 Tax=Bryobacter aggregatus TaxID=360054 RepID=UPI0004E1D5C8|nr:hypothetical protein [Bryobacter aggregatus]